MKQSIWVGMALGAVLATAAGAVATSGFWRAKPVFAEVLASRPIKEQVSVPHEVCQEIQSGTSVQDERQMAGIALGALAGGLLASQMDEGRDPGIAALAGAIAGGYVGGQMQQAQPQIQPSVPTPNGAYGHQVTELRCARTVTQEERITGYEVKYVVGGQLKQARTDYDPGTQILLQDGQPVLLQAQLPQGAVSLKQP